MVLDMTRHSLWIRRFVLMVLCAVALAACATNPKRPPDPGSKLWYQQRMTEIETAKTNGELTPEQYLKLKNEADATRAAHLDAMRRNNNTEILIFHSGHAHLGGHR